MHITISNMISLFNPPNKLVEELKKDLIINNPKWQENIKYGYSNFKTPRKLSYIIKGKVEGQWIIPKGYLTKLCNSHSLADTKYKVNDKRFLSSPINIKTKIKLKPYQEEAIKKLMGYCYYQGTGYDAVYINSGILQAPTGSGKTVMAIEMIARRKQNTLIIVHTKELLYQWRDRLLEFTNLKDIGLYGDGHKSIKPITIGIVNSLNKIKQNISGNKFGFGFVIVDECFVAGTLIDGKPIEQIKVGDFVNSYNHKTNRIEKKKVTNIFKSKPKTLCTVKIKGISPITCTESHPFFTKRNYLTPKQLNTKIDSMLCIANHFNNLEGEKGENKKNSNNKLLCLRKKSKMQRRKTMENIPSKSKRRESLLLRQMHKRVYKKSKREVCKIFKRIQQKTLLRKNEKTQSHVQTRKHRKSKNDQKGKWHSTYMERETWRKWAIHTFSNTFSYCFRMANGISYQNRTQSMGWEWIPNLLQSRHREQEIKNRNRNRWENAQLEKNETIRSKKRKETHWSRLENIKIHKQGSDGKFEGLCPKGYVYNIEVEDNNNYFANGVLVHNCHRTPASTFTNTLIKLNTCYMLGLSATPYRRDGLGKVINFFMGELLHKIEINKLQEEGYIMKATLKIIETKFSPFVADVNSYQSLIKKLTKDWERNNLIVNQILGESQKGTCLVLSDRKSHCYDLSDMLLYEYDMPNAILTGSSKPKERLKTLDDINKKKVNVLIATGQLVGEGFDLKHLTSIFICTPIRYEGRLIQYIGRILRKAQGKDRAVVYDFKDPCWLLQGSFKKRLETYKQIGIEREE